MLPSNVARSMFDASFARTLTVLCLLPFALCLLPSRACAQRGGADPMESYRILMQRRMEESQRAVNETLRRRFEENKERGRFPSDSGASAKPGVVRAVSPEEQKALARNERGLEYFSKNDYGRAIKEYEEAVRIYPALAAAHNNMGTAYFALARYEEAAHSFREAVRLEPRYAQAHFNLALAFIKLGREREANQSLVSAARAYALTGDENLVAGRLKDAEESYRALLQIDPDYAFAHQRLGLVHNAARRFDEAAAAFKRALQKTPDDAPALEGLAEAYLGLRDYTAALDAATHAARLSPDSANAHYLAGLAHASLGQRDQALADLARLQQLKASAPAKLLSDFIEKRSPEKR
jgi:tetratricopeptide (TPR) repeat protein